MTTVQERLSVFGPWLRSRSRRALMQTGLPASRVGVLAFLALAAAAGALAHHNFVGDYFPDRMVSIRGTVAEIRFSNPHIRIVLEEVASDGTPVKDAQGNPVRWSAETMSVRVAQRRNFNRGSLQVGQIITLRGWPSRKEGVREMGVNAIIQESGHVFLARENIRGGRRSPPTPYPGSIPE